MSYQEQFDHIASEPLEKLFQLVGEKEESSRKHIARFLIDKYLQDRAVRLQVEANKPMLHRATWAVVISVVALVVAAAPLLYKLYLNVG